MSDDDELARRRRQQEGPPQWRMPQWNVPATSGTAGSAVPLMPGDVLAAYERLIVSAGEDPERDGLRDTPLRAARAWSELTAGYAISPGEVLRSFDADGYDEMVVVRAMPFFSLCEHHLLPFHGHAGIAYIPDGRIVGLSKLQRLVEVFARRLQVQERLTHQIAEALDEHLKPIGVCVVASARHLCMEMRGVKAAGAMTTTSAVRGAMATKPAARAEALALLHASTA